MQYITPRDDTSTLSLPERTFLRSAARGTLPSSSSSRSSSVSIPLRLDGRKPSESRPVRLSFGRCHNRSECVVQFASGTRSAASVRAELVPPPNADRPNDGQVKFGIDVGPMGCMGYEVVDRPVSNYGHGEAVDGGGGGGGGADAPYVQRLKSNRILRVLERTLLIGGAMDAEALCVRGGSWVWRLHVDVSLLDDGGNSIDACVLAAVAALRHYRLPEVNVVDSTGEDDDDNAGGRYREASIIHSDDREPSPLPLHHTPLTATFALFADETGTTTSVSALLDPSDREELACDGLLTWGYNKYGEMCCLDFPGGCELRPRQLMASAKLGKSRCVEVCEMIETALEEAEGKAQRERMERLKQQGVANVVSSSSALEDSGTTTVAVFSDAMDVDEPSSAPDEDRTTDAAAMKEEEEYRARALDYSSGHFAASVKEDKQDKKGPNNPGKKNPRGDTSSLFNAILRSAQSSTLSMETSGDGGLGKLVVSDYSSLPREREPMVEIIAHRVKEVSLSEVDNWKPREKNAVSSSQLIAIDSDEEEVVQLRTEFLSSMQRDAGPIPPQVSAKARTEAESYATSNGETPDAIMKSSGGGDVTKASVGGIKSKSKPAEEEDITDLSQALKKKKKTKKSKK